jgi:hypothetical protein
MSNIKTDIAVPKTQYMSKYEEAYRKDYMMRHQETRELDYEEKVFFSTPDYGRIAGTSELGFFFRINGVQVRVQNEKSSRPQSTSPVTPPPKAVCSFWQRGTCTRGVNCPFRHSE